MKNEKKWQDINWREALKEKAQLQHQLYEALKKKSSEKEVKKLHNKILMNFSCRAIAVRRVTTNNGGKTPGVDGVVWTTDAQKMKAINRLKTINSNKYVAQPVRRIWIPKANSDELRPLRMPTMEDRSLQMLYSYILDVHQEHTSDPRSFGFRIGRSAKQAINYAWILSSGNKRFIMGTDIAKAYDSVSHEWILENCPINKNVMRQWLKAGVCESGSEQVSYADNGVPQGGPISPIIFNIVMNGIDQVIMDIDEQVYPIRYADDLYVFGNTWNCVNKMKEPIKKFLKARGLKLNEAKTKIVEVNEGIDFLGYNIKEYIDWTRVGLPGRPNKKGILLIKPSRKAITRLKAKIKKIIKLHAKGRAATLILQLNPVIRGWANYFNAGGGWTETKNKLGHFIFNKLKSWVYNKHKTVGRREALKKYFKYVQRRLSYYNNWTFYGINQGKEVLLVDIQEILVNNINPIVFRKPGEYVNPYNLDPNDQKHIDSRLKRQALNDTRLSKLKQNLLRSQKGRCLICNEFINLANEAVERDHIVPLSEGGKDTNKNTMLVHKVCHQQKTNYDKAKRRTNKIVEANNTPK